MNFPSVRIEGSILSGELLDKLDSADSLGQRASDFGLESQAKLKDEIIRAWTAAQAFYTAFQYKLASVKVGAPATTETRNQWVIPLLGLLGYAELDFQSQSELVGDKQFRLSHRLRSHGAFVVHIVGAGESLDKKPSVGPRVSPHALLQEYLNLTEHVYGIVANGKLLRLLRDSTRLIKLSYVEFDLDRMFSEELFADFAVLYRLLHVTRLPKSPERTGESLLERYHQDALESGARIREGLSIAVEHVVQELGSGFLAQNESLQVAVANNSLLARELHHGLLRLIYRLLLLMVAEERGLLFADSILPRQRTLYLDHYSIARLRRLAERRALVDPAKQDLWRGLRSTFRLFETDGPGGPLGLTGLGGQLFSASALGSLQCADLDNGTLLSAIAKLSLFRQPETGRLSRVNYGALATEEFGSVYERLLELHPVVNPAVGHLPPTYGFKQAAGNERKTTGSYYTPSSLVECLLDSALDPVLNDRLSNFAKLGYKAADEAVLSLKVCDPACGSGHFLIAAAQRIARRLALLRSKGDEPSVSDLRHALREVISHCIYGVDINPMSVELCKVALWLEAMEAGKPLSFLDHHIRCGNSLVGSTPALIAKGIPDDAYIPVDIDEKKACAILKRLNTRELAGFGELFAEEDRTMLERLQQAVLAVENLPDNSVQAVEQKSAAFELLQHDNDLQRALDLANLWCGAFVIRKRISGEYLSANPRLATSRVKSTAIAALSSAQAGLFGETFDEPTTRKSSLGEIDEKSALSEVVGVTSGHLRRFAKGEPLPDGMMDEIRHLAGEYNFFHWHLSFPEVYKRNGFDVILGNPPWEKLQTEELQFFATRKPEIATLVGSHRKTAIRELTKAEPELAASWNAQRRFDATVINFIRNSGIFPLTGVGKFNTFALFTELGFRLVSSLGRVGCIVPSGIATDDTTKLLFSHLVERRWLRSLFDFENRLGVFPGVHRSYKFCLLTLGPPEGQTTAESEFTFYAYGVEDVFNPEKRFYLSAEDISLFNPNTKTCPIFRSRRDADITKSIYGRIPVLTNEAFPHLSAYQSRIWRLLNTTDDSSQFVKRDMTAHISLVPVIEAKTIHQFDHRFATFVESTSKGEFKELALSEKNDPSFEVNARHYVNETYFRERLPSEVRDKAWFLTARNIARATDERTFIASVFPRGASCELTPYIELDGQASECALLLAQFNSLAFDYVARQKVGGTHISYFIIYQLPVFPGGVYTRPCEWCGGEISLKQWLLPRVLELVYTAWDIEPFANECGCFNPPYGWDNERRFQLRCELDAAFFHLYDLKRDDVAYILGTFPIVKRKDEDEFGSFRTKDRTLELYDALAECKRVGRAFISSLDPAPAAIRAAHPPRFNRQRVNVDVGNYILGFTGSLLRHFGGECELMKLVRSYALLLPDRTAFADLSGTQSGAEARHWVERFTQPVDASWFLPILRGMDNRQIVELKDAGNDVRVVLCDKTGPPTNSTIETDVYLVMSVLDLISDKLIAAPVKLITPKAPHISIQELEPMFV